MVFFNIHSAAKLQKNEGGTFVEIYFVQKAALCRNNEKNIFYRFFSKFFLKSPVSRIVPKNAKEGTLWDFLNVHSVAK